MHNVTQCVITSPQCFQGQRMSLVGVLLFVGSISFHTAAFAENVGRFDMLEKSFSTTNTYSNPFTQVTFSVSITEPGGGSLVVRGFHDGDGSGGQSGSVWIFRFMPRKIGAYSWTTSSNDNQLDNKSGTFTCVSSSLHGPIRIHYADPYHFMYEDGTPFLWTGDTEWRFLTEDTSVATKKDAIDFIADKKVNNLLITMANLSGTSNISWPWLGSSSSPDHSRFDLAKLKKWDEVIAYMATKGVHADLWFYSDDSASRLPTANSTNEDLYFQYMIARFGAYWHVTWNLALEFSEYRTSSWVTSRAQFVRNEDPYDRILSVHQVPGTTYAFPGNSNLDHTSLQFRESSPTSHFNLIKDNRSSTSSAGRPIPIMNEEFYLENIFMNQTTGRQAAWSQIVGGAGGYKLGPLDVNKAPSSWKSRNHFAITAVLNPWITSNVRFWHIAPNKSRVGNSSANLCGDILEGGLPQFLIFAPSGGSISVDLSDQNGTFSVKWLNPGSGSTTSSSPITAGGTISLSSPYSESVCLLEKTGSGDTTPPSLTIAVPSSDGQTVSGTLAVSGSASDDSGITKIEYQIDTTSGSWTQASGTTSWNFSVDTIALSNGSHNLNVRAIDGSASANLVVKTRVVDIQNAVDNTPPIVAITNPSANGQTVSGTITVSGTALDASGISKVEYRLDGGSWSNATGTTVWIFQVTTNTLSNGTHQIDVRATDGSAAENVSTPASRTIDVQNVNQAPVAENQTIQVIMDQSKPISLTYSDPDIGPGPYTFTKLSDPANGTLQTSPTSNDWTYTPHPGFTGTDTFEWKVNDGLVDSNVATVSMTVSETPPVAASGLAAAAVSSSQIDLTWADLADNEMGFRIERAQGGGMLAVTLKSYNGSNTVPTVQAAGAANSFKTGALVVNDRADTWTSVPAALSGKARLLTARNDRMQAPVDSKYVATLSGPAILYLPLDPRYGGAKLSWMDSSWTDSGLSCHSSAKSNWKIWKRSVTAAGEVTLGCDTSAYDGVCFVFEAAATFAEIATVGANVTGYGDTDLAANSTYTYRVLAFNAAGDSAYSNEASATTLSVPNQVPIIESAPWADPNPVLLPETTTLNVSASDPDGGPQALTYTWSKVSGPGTAGFSPNGTTQSDLSNAAFGAAGNYTLRVTVSDGLAGASGEVTVSVLAPANQPPVAAVAANPASGSAPLSVAFGGSSSSDPDGTIVSYAWNFGDGTSGSGANVSHTYADPGSYTATLTVTDDGGLSDSDSLAITVAAPPSGGLIANIAAGSGQAYEKDTLAVGKRVYVDRTYTITSLPAAFAGQEFIRTANNDKYAANAAFLTFTLSADANVYVAFDARASRLPAWLDDGAWSLQSEMLGTSDVSRKIYRKAFAAGGVSLGGNAQAPSAGAGSMYNVFAVATGSPPPPNQPPVAVVSADPESGTAPLTVSFTGIASSDPDGIIASYTWDFGDGTNSSEANPLHTYADPGSYTASLTVADDGGLTGSAAVAIAVNPPPGGGDLTVTVVSVSTGKAYQPAAAQTGARPYIDRSYAITGLSAALDGGVLIQTANNDKAVSAAAHLSFSVDRTATVFVGYDKRASVLPAWLNDGSWTLTSHAVSTTDTGASPLAVYSKTVPAGQVTLGGNLQAPASGAASHYVVVVK